MNEFSTLSDSDVECAIDFGSIFDSNIYVKAQPDGSGIRNLPRSSTTGPVPQNQPNPNIKKQTKNKEEEEEEEAEKEKEDMVFINISDEGAKAGEEAYEYDKKRLGRQRGRPRKDLNQHAPKPEHENKTFHIEYNQKAPKEPEKPKPAEKQTLKQQIRGFFHLPGLTMIANAFNLSKKCTIYYLKLLKVIVPKLAPLHYQYPTGIMIVAISNAIDVDYEGRVGVSTSLDLLILLVLIVTYRWTDFMKFLDNIEVQRKKAKDPENYSTRSTVSGLMAADKKYDELRKEIQKKLKSKQRGAQYTGA